MQMQYDHSHMQLVVINMAMCLYNIQYTYTHTCVACRAHARALCNLPRPVHLASKYRGLVCVYKHVLVLSARHRQQTMAHGPHGPLGAWRLKGHNHNPLTASLLPLSVLNLLLIFV